MAISKELWDKARLLFEHGESLNEIAKQTGINKSTISKKAKEFGWAKNEKSTLVDQEVQTIIMQDEINRQKSTLNSTELQYHNKQVIEKVNLELEKTRKFDNSTLMNQELVNLAQEGILESVTNQDGTVDKQYLATQLPNLMAISKVTETNRKQLFGTTEAYKPKEEEADEGRSITMIQYVEDKRDV